MLHITRTGLVSDQHDLARFRSDFSRCHAVVLPEFLSLDVLEYIQARLKNAHLETRSDYGADGREFAREYAADPSEMSMHLLSILLNDQSLFHALQQITGCRNIGYFQGRIYRMSPDSGHYDTWHNDCGQSRLLGLSINLSSETYTGGVFQLRQRYSGQLCFQILHTRPGSAHLFRIAADLEHRVTPVEGSGNRLVAAGWFSSGPNLLRMLKNIQ